MNKDGFTVLELLVVVLILAILSAAAIPAFSDLLQRQKIRGQANALFSMIYLARTEAIKRNKVVTVCKSINGEDCGGSWSSGWLMFSDEDKDGLLDEVDEVITSHQTSGELSIDWTAFGSDNYIRFTPRGMTLSQNGTFTICPRSKKPLLARTVVVSKLARVRMPAAGESADGSVIDCSQ